MYWLQPRDRHKPDPLRDASGSAILRLIVGYLGKASFAVFNRHAQRTGTMVKEYSETGTL